MRKFVIASAAIALTAMLSGMALPLTLTAQNPAVILQNYTSRIDSTVADGYAVTQQIGASLGIPDVVDGDDVMYQGLFGVLSGVPAGGLLDVGFNYAAATDDVELYYRSEDKALHVVCGSHHQGSRLLVVNSSGQAVGSFDLNEDNIILDISNLSSGVYMAGYIVDNLFSKTLKFIVK
ncbi:MAG: T9SS type A sorting domain-containing protein [Bacteroides sp.]|nr:T9SS type A sorting domain-containing protein [Bacteroides sp.]